LRERWKILILCSKSTGNATPAPVYKIPTHDQKKKQAQAQAQNELKNNSRKYWHEYNSLWMHHWLIKLTLQPLVHTLSLAWTFSLN